ncbi:pentapeptide repeat-containing protein [Leptothoe sp. EHU-05/26/07-4]
MSDSSPIPEPQETSQASETSQTSSKTDEASEKPHALLGNWDVIDKIFEYISALELKSRNEGLSDSSKLITGETIDELQDLYNNKKLFSQNWLIKKETAFQFINKEFDIPKDEIRKSYHKFMVAQRIRHTPQRIDFTKPLIWLRASGIWFVNLSGRWVVLFGGVASLITASSFIWEWSASNQLRREEILQAREQSIQAALQSIDTAGVGDRSLQIKSAIELLAAEGRSLDGITINQKNLTLLNLSPNNLEKIKKSLTARGQWAWFTDFFKGNNAKNRTADTKDINAEPEPNCVQRSQQEGWSNSIRDGITCVSMARSSFRGSKLQSSRFDHAHLLQADFSDSSELENETGLEENNASAQVVKLSDDTTSNGSAQATTTSDNQVSSPSNESVPDSQEVDSNAISEIAAPDSEEGLKPDEKKSSGQHQGTDVAYKTRTDLTNVSFYNADLTNVTFENAILEFVNFRWATFGGFGDGINENMFNGADLIGADFRSAKISGDNKVFIEELRKAKNWKSAIYDPELRTYKSTSEGNRFLCGEIKFSVFSTESPPKFLGHFPSQMTKGKFIDHIKNLASNGDDEIKQIPLDCFDFQSFRDSDFLSNELELFINANFTDSTLNKVNFSGTNLSNASLKNANLTHTNLTGITPEMIDVKELVKTKNERLAAYSKELRGEFCKGDNSVLSSIGEPYFLIHDGNSSSQVLGHLPKGGNPNGEGKGHFDEIQFKKYIGELRGSGSLDFSCYSFKNFSNVDFFEGEDLQRADFGRSHLVLLSLEETNLSEANFSHSKLARVSFKGSNLSNVNWTEADLQYADLTEVSSDELNLEDLISETSNWKVALFSQSMRRQEELCRKVQFLIKQRPNDRRSIRSYDAKKQASGNEDEVISKTEVAAYLNNLREYETIDLSCYDLTVFQNTKFFEGENFSGADFSNSILTRVSLANSDLSDAQLAEANLYYTNFSGIPSANIDVEQILAATNNSVAIYSDELRNTDQLCGIANFLLQESAKYNSTVIGHIPGQGEFTENNLKSYLEGRRQENRLDLSCLSFEKFQNSDFLAGLDLGSFDFQRSNLKEINLSDANLARIDFSGADLTGANLDNADLLCTDFRGALGLTIEQVKTSKNKGFAIYDAEFRSRLEAANIVSESQQCDSDT